MEKRIGLAERTRSAPRGGAELVSGPSTTVQLECGASAEAGLEKLPQK
jgi:hypothetical protein